MTERKWNKGPPPHVGWWNASTYRVDHVWRWWNGRNWSAAVSCFEVAVCAASIARNVVHVADEMEWSDYYPENARVPRVKP